MLAACSRQLLFLYVLPAGVCSAPRSQWAASRLLKSSWSEHKALEAAKVADGLRVSFFPGVSVTQNESGARAEARWWRSGPLVAWGGAFAGVGAAVDSVAMSMTVAAAGVPR